MEDQVEDKILLFEATMSAVSLDKLREYCVGVKMAGLQDGMRKTQLMRLARRHLEENTGGSLEENLAFLENATKALKSLVGDATKVPADPEPPKDEGAEDKGKTGETDTKVTPTDATAAELAQIIAANPRSSLFTRQLKIIGIIAGDLKDSKTISYSNLLGQVADARSQGFKDDEIARAIRRSISTSSPLRAYFDAAPDTNLTDMIAMLRDCYHEKTCAEMFHDLGSLAQKDDETATDFLVRGFELRQKVSSASAVEGQAYSNRLIQETFCRTLRTGLINERVRSHMNQFLDVSKPASDKTLLHEINIVSSESKETAVKRKATSRKVAVHEAAATAQTEDKFAMILKPLIQGIDRLNKQVEDLNASSTSSQKTTYVKKGFRCKKCRQSDEPRCNHCFNCCESTHQAKDCPKSKNQ